MAYRIELLTKKHLKAYVEFKNQCSRESAYINPTTEEKVTELLDKYDADKNLTAYLLLDGFDIVGQLFLELKPKKNICHIALLSVLEAYYGKGAAKQLMQKAIAVANNHRCDAIELIVSISNKRALTFYERFHFRPVGEYSKKHLRYALKLHNVSTEAVADVYIVPIKPPLYKKW